MMSIPSDGNGEQHLNLLSLFSGAGGLDLGFEKQGFTPILAYDLKPSAVETYNINRNGTKKIARVADLGNPNISDMIIQDIESLGKRNTPRGVLGGPPCQYFSMGNIAPRDSQDIRRLLPRRYASILKKLNKKYNIDFFLLENVDGLAKPRHEKDFKKILRLFEAAGFHTSWKVLDAHDFGVPQIRKRLFIIGWNKKKYPKDAYQFPFGKPSRLTVRDAIYGLGRPRYFAKNLDPRDFNIHPNHWTMLPRSEKFQSRAPDNKKKRVRSFKRLSWDEPSYTIAYGHNEIHLHPRGTRRLSIYEAMLLQGFPKGKNKYRLVGTLSEQVSLISDAVPPPLASSLAFSIQEFMRTHRLNETG
jgi:DNA (cytosine-5)-methyltransferase 1